MSWISRKSNPENDLRVPDLPEIYQQFATERIVSGLSSLATKEGLAAAQSNSVAINEAVNRLGIEYEVDDNGKVTYIACPDGDYFRQARGAVVWTEFEFPDGKEEWGGWHESSVIKVEPELIIGKWRESRKQSNLLLRTVRNIGGTPFGPHTSAQQQIAQRLIGKWRESRRQPDTSPRQIVQQGILGVKVHSKIISLVEKQLQYAGSSNADVDLGKRFNASRGHLSLSRRDSQAYLRIPATTNTKHAQDYMPSGHPKTILRPVKIYGQPVIEDRRYAISGEMMGRFDVLRHLHVLGESFGKDQEIEDVLRKSLDQDSTFTTQAA